jgi:hypothetical protein
MRLLRSFWRLTPAERRILVQATFLLIVTHFALGQIPFPILRRLVTGRRRPGTARLSSRALAEHVVWAVTAAGKRIPGPPMCLSRALTVQAMLARRGHPSRLHVGVVRGSQGKVEGHAWVECEGRILIGGTASDIGQFTRLAAFDVEAPLELQPAAELRDGR